jgi:hypothetical protein
MRHNGSMLGLWIVRTPEAESLVGRVQGELYLLAFSNAPRAGDCMRALGAGGTPFYVCNANLEGLLREARSAGVNGFIVDYDAERAAFASAHRLPVPVAAAARAAH